MGVLTRPIKLTRKVKLENLKLLNPFQLETITAKKCDSFTKVGLPQMRCLVLGNKIFITQNLKGVFS